MSLRSLKRSVAKHNLERAGYRRVNKMLHLIHWRDFIFSFKAKPRKKVQKEIKKPMVFRAINKIMQKG